MATQTATRAVTAGKPDNDGEKLTTRLCLASGNGPVYRDVLRTPPRDASPSEIPIIDVSGLLLDDDDDDDDGPSSSSSSLVADRKAAVARQIRDAATNNGFFYIKNHGIPESVMDDARSACLDFFRQPAAVKERADVKQSQWYPPVRETTICDSSRKHRSEQRAMTDYLTYIHTFDTPDFNGYKPPRTQRINPYEPVDQRETFSWTYDPRYDPDVPDPAAVPPEVARYLRCEDFHWEATSNLPHFKAAVIAYWRSCLALARRLVRAFALSLDLPEDFFAEKFTHPDAALALNYYRPLGQHSPPSPREPSTRRRRREDDDEEEEEEEEEEGSISQSQSQSQSQRQVSIGSHTDFQLFTILWQDDVGGLQVLNRAGQWIRARPVAGTFVVNIADYLQRITNDRYASTVHRAQNWSGRERVSMPFFFGFNLNESCGVLEGCVGPGEAKRYDEISCDEWVKRRARAMHRVDEGDGHRDGRGDEEK
ncbi:2OG-Fe(II) oxygenase [Xylariomycetidae sp. FL2044]|nr:2OG-Fe(II) oxygenase [Xylariomycetidae sp. FL2044]